MFLCLVTCNVWLGQIYPVDIVLLDALLCHILHWSQVNGFSPVWMFMCNLRVDESEKLFPHWSQVNGFSPVWTLMWSSISRLHVKLFPHWVQVKDFLALLFFKSFCLGFSPLLTWFFSSTSLNSSFSSLSSINSETKEKTVHLSVTH